MHASSADLSVLLERTGLHRMANMGSHRRRSGTRWRRPAGPLRSGPIASSSSSQTPMRWRDAGDVNRALQQGSAGVADPCFSQPASRSVRYPPEFKRQMAGGVALRFRQLQKALALAGGHAFAGVLGRLARGL